MQRFKAALVTGVWNDNPEDLRRDPKGEYVLYKDAMKRINELEKNYQELAQHHNEHCTCLEIY